MEKKWYKSKAVWGGLIAVVAAIASALGYAISPEEQDTIIEAVIAVVGGVGGVLAVYGRVKADSTIKK
jgi:dihydrodipicolinate synthase/N-acetylneuraminate lyase|tara:strand:+ start:15572 stop:15775 length:204 start_codon:yes stop_codon:yes gene_type:complete